MTDQQRADSCPPWGRAKMPRVGAFSKNATAFTRAYCSKMDRYFGEVLRCLKPAAAGMPQTTSLVKV
ncbi:MAG: hypothetical protein HOI15_12175 [Opitutales bacterium]|nr:hypothetical protein [Opitutales bacterium]